MKIVLAHYKFYVQGGPERYMLKFMQLAQEKGHAVIPFSVENEKNMETEYAYYFVPIKKSGRTGYGSGKFKLSQMTPVGAIRGIRNLFHNPDAYRKMKELLQTEKPDLLYVLIPGSLSADIIQAANEEHVPVILRLSDFQLICGCNTLLRGTQICEECIHGDYKNMVRHKCVHHSGMLSLLRYWSLRYKRKHEVYRFVDAVIAPPRFTADKIVESGYFPAEKVYVNPTFLDCSKVPVSSVFKDYVLCLGRFSPEKGFIYVIRALQYLKDLPVRVAVTGDKENCDAELKAIIKEYELEDKVQFVGFLHGKDLERITSESLCVACPAIWYDNMPNVVLEAYAYGKPVIASNLGSLAEIVEDGKTGLLFEPKNPRQIADCIRKLYENPTYSAELGRNARQKCERDFSPEAHWNKFLEIYQIIRGEKYGKA